MESDLLKEAIADAKAVRQTALANAKAALEEAFGSRLEAMLTPKLEEETADAISAPAPAPTAAPAAGLAQEEVVNETDIEEIIRELESEIPQAAGAPPMGAPAPAPMGAPPVGGPPMGAPAPAPMGAPPVGGEMDLGAGAPPMGAPAPAPMGAPPVDGAAPAPAPSPEGEEGMDEEIDVNELLESLKNEDDEDEENEDKGNKPPWLKENAPVKSSGIATSDNKLPSEDARSSSHIESAAKDRVGGGEGYKSGVADATTASRPNQAKNATKDNLSTPGGALKETKETGFPEGATVKTDDATKAERPNQAKNATKDNLSTPGGALKENEQLKAQLNEAEEALTYLRQQLNEINLLNAKLLYTNRLFKAYSMDNNKKMKIVEMFDLAKNVREVKMTYAVIAESLNFGADFKKIQSSKVQNITEGMASKPIAGTAPRQIIAESAKSEMVQKFQRLAGIPVPKQPTKK